MKKILIACLLASCAAEEPTDGVPEPPPPPATCEVWVAQTPDSPELCAVTLTVEVKCEPDVSVGSAYLIALTSPYVETGEATREVGVTCGETTRTTFPGMACFESVTGIVQLDFGASCDATAEGLY